MKKTYRIEELDCANCAAKMERAIKKLDGVTDASVSFLTQRLTVETDRETLDGIIDEVVRVCRKVEPDCVIHA